MILTKKFVFVHVPKTAGSFVTDLLRDHSPEAWCLHEIEAHTRAQDTPATHRELPKFACVRNPFAWYVSWHTYHLQQYKIGKVEDSHLWAKCSELGTLEFLPMMRNLFSHRDVVRNGNPHGFFTTYLQHFCGEECRLVDLLRVERIRAELPAWLQRHTELPPALDRAIRATPEVNVSNRRHYSEFYDAEVRELVERKDRHILDRFNYAFETPE